MTDAQEPREWWLTFGVHLKVSGIPVESPTEETVHVIEFSAYERAVADLRESNELLEHLRDKAEKYKEGEQFYRREWESTCERYNGAVHDLKEIQKECVERGKQLNELATEHGKYAKRIEARLRAATEVIERAHASAIRNDIGDLECLRLIICDVEKWRAGK